MFFFFLVPFVFALFKLPSGEICSLRGIKVGLGISRTNADSQWNPVYNAFHQIFCCGNETICRWFCKSDLDAANLRPALEQGCGKQTPSARKLFFRANLLSARPYESCKIFKGQRRRNAFSKLVHRQYKSFPPDRFCQLEIQNTTGLSNKLSTA